MIDNLDFYPGEGDFDMGRHGSVRDRAMRTPSGATHSEGEAAWKRSYGSGVGIVVVFQDPLTRQWATEMWERVTDVLYQEGAHLRFWRMDDLVHPRVAEEAIRAAAEANILMVALRDVAVPPPALCVWNEGWLAQRKALTGLLVSLVGVHPLRADPTSHLEEYLRAIALRGSLDYMARQQPLPPEAISAFDLESLAGRANATTQIMGEILHHGRYPGDHQHWGINE